MKRHHRFLSALTLLVVLLAALPTASIAASGETWPISIGLAGSPANDESRFPSISADGRSVAFQSAASNLIETDTNGSDDIFILDFASGITRVSVGTGGTQSNGPSSDPAISGDGRYVAFVSAASNLAAGDTNGLVDIFVRDLNTGTTTRVSVATGGGQANAAAQHPAISADGRYVVFESSADNLVAGDTNSAGDVFLRDLMTGTTTRVSVTTGGGQANGISQHPAISADGRYVAFDSAASNLVAGDTNLAGDVFVYDRVTGTTTRVSVATGGAQSNSASGTASISGDGRYVAFISSADNLVAEDTNSTGDVFVHDRMTGTTTRVSVATDGTQGNGYSTDPVISVDGRYVAFGSVASNLVFADTNGKGDIFVHDRTTGITARISVGTGGIQSNDVSWGPSISAFGRYVTFFSPATNLYYEDMNGFTDVFFHEPDYSPPALIFGTASIPGYNRENVAVSTSMLRVQFSKNVLHDGSPHAANSLNNYLLLRSGENDTFDTPVSSPTVCDAAHVPAGDDEKIDIESIDYDQGAFSASLNIDPLFAPLADGEYRLYLCGAASILDFSGVPLNNGVNQEIDFLISAPTFAPAVNYSVGTNPTSAAVGDFNGDGNLDFVAGNNAGSSVSVRWNDGDGTFDGSPVRTYTVGLTPVSVAVGDFNGDGKTDIAAANFQGNSVRVLWNDGDGTFDGSPALTYSIASLPHSVAVGDFNGDNKPDLVTANTGSNKVSVLWNDGDGTFDDHIASYSVGTRPNSVAVGDFNGDGKPDLVTANDGSNNVSVLWNDGDGTFDSSPALIYTAGSYTNSVAVGDFNGDDNPDLAVVNNGSEDVNVLWNDGDGTFDSSPALTYSVGQDPIGIAAGDFDGDSKPDLVTANSGSDNVTVLWNHGDGTFDYTARYGVDNLPYPVAVGDFNGDGKPDLAVANLLTNNVSVLLNIRKGNTTTTLADPPDSIAYGDSLSLTATVTADIPGTPSGEVQFKNGETNLGAPVALTGGQATLTINTLPAGTRTLTVKFLANEAYAGSTSASETVAVSPAPLTVTTDDITKEYGEPLPSFTVNYNGFVNGENESALGGTLAFDTDATSLSPVGTYSVTPKGLTSTNYAITFIDGTLTVADTVSPTVLSIQRAAGAEDPTSAASVDFTVTFSEPVTGVETEAPFPDFGLTTSEGIRGAAVTAVSIDGTTYTVTVNTGIGSGTLQINVVDDDSIQDGAGNLLGGVGTGTLPGEFYSVEKQSTLPGKPTGLLPQTGFVTNNPQPTFSWDSATDAAEYEILFASDSGFMQNEIPYFVTEPSFTPETPMAEGKYYWRVRAYNLANEPGAWSAVRALTIDLVGPAAPVLQSPLDGVTVRSVPTFRWKAVSGAVLYQFELDNDSDFSSPVASVEQRTLSRKPAGSLRGMYYWHVRAKDAAGNWSEWSSVFTITINRGR